MTGTYVAGGRTVAAERGWDWITAGWALFKKNPGVWIALIVVMLLIYIVLALIPLLGSLASLVLGPAFAAGLVAGARAQDEGGALQVSHLFAGFRDKLGPLVVVGILYLVASVAIALLVGVTSGVGLFNMFGGTAPASIPPGAIFTLIIAVLIMAGLMVPVMMAVWYAPALVMFQGKDAVAAMKESFSGCLKNIVPFLIYGVVLLVFSVLASIPFGLGWLVLGPVLAASVYTSYKDIFTAA